MKLFNWLMETGRHKPNMANLLIVVFLSIALGVAVLFTDSYTYFVLLILLLERISEYLIKLKGYYKITGLLFMLSMLFVLDGFLYLSVAFLGVMLIIHYLSALKQERLEKNDNN